jgi:hypothetical protein
MQTQPQLRSRERRRTDRTGRVLRASGAGLAIRATRETFDALADGFPCSLIGHRWVEIPPSLRSTKSRATGRVDFGCARCSQRAGFTS